MMKKIDHHVHSNFSGDCQTSMGAMIQRGRELGLSEIMFTDHYDLEHPSTEKCFELDIENYVSEIESLRKQNKDMKIKMGIEIGYQQQIHEKLTAMLEQYDFDFVICSTHSWNGIDVGKLHLMSEKSQYQWHREYLQQIQDAVKNFEHYDVYGHLDFIARYGNFEKQYLSYEEHQEIIDDILGTIISKGKGIELNTSGIRYGLKQMHPNQDILSRYVQLGGKFVTLGSDAHQAKDLCSDFDLAVEQLQQVGMEYIANYEKRIPQFQPLQLEYLQAS